MMAAQLSALGTMHAVVPDLATRQRLSAVVPQIYSELTALDEHQMEVARQQLLGAPCIWVGDAFTVADRVALRSVHEAAMLQKPTFLTIHFMTRG